MIKVKKTITIGESKKTHWVQVSTPPQFCETKEQILEHWREEEKDPIIFIWYKNYSKMWNEHNSDHSERGEIFYGRTVNQLVNMGISTPPDITLIKAIRHSLQVGLNEAKKLFDEHKDADEIIVHL